MNRAVAGLSQLGLTDYEARAYIILLRESPLTAYEISKNSGIPSSKVYEVIRKMESRQIVQSIQGERSKMFIPVSPDEFIQNFRSTMEDSLQSVKDELKGFRVVRASNYTWHISDYEGLIAKARRILDTCQKGLLLSVWPQEAETLLPSLRNAEDRGIRIAIIHHGNTNMKCGQIFRHPVKGRDPLKGNRRTFSLVADSKEALTGKITDRQTEAVWSTHEGFVGVVEEYVRHDVYLMKIMERFNPLLRGKFGLGYEKLLDVYSDTDLTS